MTDQASEQTEQTVPVCYRHTDRETHIRCQRCERPICPDCMRQAPVGFQCPQCVAEGARSTRQGRTAYGGRRSADPALTSRVLIGINLAVFLFLQVTGGRSSDWLDRLALLPRTTAFGPYPDGSIRVIQGVGDSPVGDGGAYWQLVTSMFTHVDLLHIGFNMLALWVLGPQLEAAMGRARFLSVYLLSGLAGSAAVVWLSAEYSLTIGASGAVYGLMGALLVVAIKVGGDVRSLLGWIGLNFAFTFFASSFISWQGHLGGFVGGVLLGTVIAYAPRERRTPVQVGGIVAVALLILAATVTRLALWA